MESLLFLVQKHDGFIKARHCANGSIQWNWISSDNMASLKFTESVLLSTVIDAEEECNIAVIDVPNAFVQTEVSEWDDNRNCMVMKIRGILVDILCNIDPSYKEFVVIEHGENVLYTHILRAIYGLLVSAFLFYKKFRSKHQERGIQGESI